MHQTFWKICIYKIGPTVFYFCNVPDSMVFPCMYDPSDTQWKPSCLGDYMLLQYIAHTYTPASHGRIGQILKFQASTIFFCKIANMHIDGIIEWTSSCVIYNFNKCVCSTSLNVHGFVELCLWYYDQRIKCHWGNCMISLYTTGIAWNCVISRDTTLIWYGYKNLRNPLLAGTRPWYDMDIKISEIH